MFGFLRITGLLPTDVCCICERSRTQVTLEPLGKVITLTWLQAQARAGCWSQVLCRVLQPGSGFTVDLNTGFKHLSPGTGMRDLCHYWRTACRYTSLVLGIDPTWRLHRSLVTRGPQELLCSCLNKGNRLSASWGQQYSDNWSHQSGLGVSLCVLLLFISGTRGSISQREFIGSYNWRARDTTRWSWKASGFSVFSMLGSFSSFLADSC